MVRNRVVLIPEFNGYITVFVHRIAGCSTSERCRQLNPVCAIIIPKVEVIRQIDVLRVAWCREYEQGTSLRGDMLTLSKQGLTQKQIESLTQIWHLLHRREIHRQKRLNRRLWAIYGRDCGSFGRNRHWRRGRSGLLQ